MRGKLFLILLIALILRLVSLVNIPPGLNRDEAAIGYNAYSIMKTARDEHDILLPMSLKSFGDWKLPGYIYASIPSIAVFGLNEFAVRFPSVFFGVITVFLIYLTANKLFHNPTVGLIAAGLMAISPWHIFFSRVASEANLALFLMVMGFYLLLISETKSKWMPVGLSCIALSMWVYHGQHVFVPLITIVLLWWLRKKLTTNAGLIGLVLLVLISGTILSLTLFSADKTKISGLSVLNDPVLIYEHIDQNRLIYQNQFLAKIFNNKAIFFIEKTIQNYLLEFSPEFLFIKGGGNLQHNIPDFGNLYPLDGLFIPLGLFLLFFKKEKYAHLLLIWMLLSPLGSALTKDAPHTARTFVVLPVYIWMVAYGIYYGVKLIRSIFWQRLAFGLTILLFIISCLFFINRYFILFPYKSSVVWGNGMKQMVIKLAAIKSGYQQIIVSRPDYSPYIYYLFYTRSDPRLFQQQAQYYPETAEGFAHLAQFDGVEYQKINWAEELLVPNRLYIDWVEGIPSGATNSSVLITKNELATIQNKYHQDFNLKIGDYVTSRIRDQILLPDGKPLFFLIETRLGTPSAVRI